MHSLLLGFATITASIALAGCSSSSTLGGPQTNPHDDGGPANDGNVPVTDAPSGDGSFVNKCAAAGGMCVALVPNACPAGYTEADYSVYPCAPPGQAGVTCCLPADTDGGIDSGPDGQTDGGHDGGTEGGPAGDGGASELCTSTGGTVGQNLCCDSVSSFPDTCLIGACGCAPSGSSMKTVCNCPSTECYDQNAGCTVGGL